MVKVHNLLYLRKIHTHTHTKQKKSTFGSDIYLLFPLHTGISGSSGEFWKQTRMFTVNALRDFGFGRKSLESKLMEEVDAFIEVIQNTEGKAFDIKKVSYTSVSNVICSIVFGRRFQHGSHRFEDMLILLDQNFKLAGLTGLVGLFPFLRFLPGDMFGVKRLLKNTKDIRQFFVDQIQSHRVAFDEDDIRDFIDAFLKEERKHLGNASSIFTGNLWYCVHFLPRSALSYTVKYWIVYCGFRKCVSGIE